MTITPTDQTKVTVTCPECGEHAEFDSLRRAAEEFCERCDYPLFWARPDGPVLAADVATDVTRRRLPGTNGRVVVGHRSCPACAEQNPLSGVLCIRCGSLLDPPPPPEPVVEAPPPPPAPAPVVIVAPPRRRWWPWALAAAVLTIALSATLALVL